MLPRQLSDIDRPNPYEPDPVAEDIMDDLGYSGGDYSTNQFGYFFTREAPGFPEGRFAVVIDEVKRIFEVRLSARIGDTRLYFTDEKERPIRRLRQEVDEAEVALSNLMSGGTNSRNHLFGEVGGDGRAMDLSDVPEGASRVLPEPKVGPL